MASLEQAGNAKGLSRNAWLYEVFDRDRSICNRRLLKSSEDSISSWWFAGPKESQLYQTSLFINMLLVPSLSLIIKLLISEGLYIWSDLLKSSEYLKAESIGKVLLYQWNWSLKNHVIYPLSKPSWRSGSGIILWAGNSTSSIV